MPSTSRIASTACIVVLALAAPASALTDKEKEALGQACVAAANVCLNSCAATYPNREISFNDGLLYDSCANKCNAIETRCITSIPERTVGKGSGGGLVLDPGTGNPPPSFNPKPYSLPGGGVLSK